MFTLHVIELCYFRLCILLKLIIIINMFISYSVLYYFGGSNMILVCDIIDYIGITIDQL